MKKLTAAVFSTMLLTTPFATHANLIVNGSFETPDVASPGWSSFAPAAVPGWGAATRVEIWDDLFGFESYEGDQHAELNSTGTGPYTLFQTFSTVAGQAYSFDFAYSARRNGRESFRVDITDALSPAVLFSRVFTDHTVFSWSTYNTMFAAASASTTVTFTSLMPAGTVGNLLDDVRVEVPEPGTLGVFSLALAGLAARRFKKA